jgi:hypothetical protein
MVLNNVETICTEKQKYQSDEMPFFNFVHLVHYGMFVFIIPEAYNKTGDAFIHQCGRPANSIPANMKTMARLNAGSLYLGMKRITR